MFSLNAWLRSKKHIIRGFKDRLKKTGELNVEGLLTRYPPAKVQEILEKRADSKKKRAIEDLAYYHIRCGDMDKALNLLEKHRLQASSTYVKFVIYTRGNIAEEIDRQLKVRGKIPKQLARLFAKSVMNREDKDRLQRAVLTAPSISDEKAVWRLLVIGQASRCVGDYLDALTAYRTAFQRAVKLYARALSGESQLKANKVSKGVFDSEKAWRALNEFKALGTSGWFIDAGTLLGFIREGSFLQHDYDLDFGISEAAAFQETRKKLFYSPLFEIKPARVDEVLKVQHANGMDIDIFLYQRYKDKMFKKSHVYRWDFDSFEPEMRRFEDVSLPVPAHPEKHLEATYGDWWVPRKGFDGRYDALNVSFPNIDELECVLLNKSIRALQKGDKTAFDKEVHMLQRIGRPPSFT